MPCEEKFHLSKLFLRMAILVVAMLLGCFSVAWADGDRDRDRDRGRDRDPEIQSVITDFHNEEFTIVGKHFGTNMKDVKVSLATFGPLTVEAVIDTRVIIAQFPVLPVNALAVGEEGLPPGDYVLRVEIDGEDDEYGLTIGAVGPQGVTGKDGMNGANGKDGSSCSIEGTIVTCNGTSSNVQGPPGGSERAQPEVQTISKNFGQSPADQKIVTARCPVGEVVVGGGFNLSVPDASAAALKSIIVKTSNPDGDDAWTAIAEEHTPTELDWDLFAFARCMAPHVHVLQ